MAGIIQLVPLFIGLLAGVSSGMFGIGGGLIIVPLLMLAFGFATQKAVAISLASMLLPVGIFGVYEYWRAKVLGPENLWTVLLIDIGLVIGVYIGARMALDVPPTIMNKIFSGFLVLVAIRLWFKA